MQSSTDDDIREDIEANTRWEELLFLGEELTKLNPGVPLELGCCNYLSLFKDEQGLGLSIQVVPTGNHLYQPSIVGSHKYMVKYQTLNSLLRPRRNNFTPHELYEWYEGMKIIYTEKMRGESLKH